MPTFNPLKHPISFSRPLWLAHSEWITFVPFAFTLVDLLRPRMIVEVGTSDGVSYFAFCQAVAGLNLRANCYGLMSQGLNDNGKTLASLKKHQDLLYGSFSHIAESSFESLPNDFVDRSVDLLHLKGNHSYTTSRQVFEMWLPKLSGQGVVLLTGAYNHAPGCGIPTLWREIKLKYPHFELVHDGGLGLVSIGAGSTNEFRELLNINEPEISLIRDFYRQQGKTSKAIAGAEPQPTPEESELNSNEQRIQLLSSALKAREKEAEEREMAAQATFRELEGTLYELEETRKDLHASSLQLSVRVSQLNAILNSRAWRWVTRYGHVKNFVFRATSKALGVEMNGRSAPTASELYNKWVNDYDSLTDLDREAIGRRIQLLTYKPLISVVIPVFNPPERWLRRAIESVQQQLYTNWELCLADDCSTKPHVRAVLEEYATKDPRIKAVFRERRGHISLASNSALEMSSGEFVGFLDHDDELAEHALYMVTEELNLHPEADFVYCDEDKIDSSGSRFGPNFKPDWSPDFLYSLNYICHLAIYRSSILKQIGGFRPGYEGSQDYDLVLRVAEQIPENHIRHIPHILYHWRAVPGSLALDLDSKGYAHEAAREAIRSHFKRRQIAATVTTGFESYHRVKYPVPTPSPLISLIIGTRDRVDLLRHAVEGVLQETSYPEIELLIVNNQSREAATLEYLREIERDSRVRVIEYDAPFNFSALNNLGVRQSRGTVVGFLNNDIEVISPEWLEEMVSHAMRPEIGAVGAKLCYRNDQIQHAGIILGIGGVAGHAHRYLPRQKGGYCARAQVLQNYSAVTGACLILRREVFDEVDGFDETDLQIALNDVDLCLRIRALGYRILWTPYAELYHLESASRGLDDTPERSRRLRRESRHLRSKWGSLLMNDPYYNPNFSLGAEDFSLAFPPRALKPWRQAR